jgi:iron complex outermembrane receptor protein
VFAPLALLAALVALAPRPPLASPSVALRSGIDPVHLPTFVVAGRVVDARSGAPLSDATVRARGAAPRAAATTDADGRFRLDLDASATLVVERAGYATLEREVAAGDTALVLALAPLDGRGTTTARALERLTVTAVRAGADAPVAQTTLDRARLERGYAGQDIPLVLLQAPSVTAYAESGSLLNYSYFRIRGVDQSRINITLDGVPLNEPEDQQVYFSDFPDLASSVQSVEIQRGVGTSTSGQSAFGGSVNFASPALAGSVRRSTLSLGGGSFGTARATLETQTGQMSNRLAFHARLSALRSDGYREGATTASNGAFVSGGYFGDRDIVKLTASTGLERNGQAYAAVSDSILRVNPRYNPLAGVGDHYRESFATLNYTRLLSPSASAGLTGYGFLTNGWYDYPSGTSGPALRYRSASRWAGLIAAAHAERGALTLDGGAHASAYSKDHRFDARPDLEYPAYDNTGHKTEASAFAKASLALGPATLFGDVQLRTAEFRYTPTAGYGLDEASARWSFVNAKTGVTVRATRALSLFASFGTTGREPTRGDLFAGADDVTPDDAPALLPLGRVRPEHVNDLELGARYAIGALQLTANAYDMRFRDEIARTGATTPLGYDLRANVGRSVRRGVELDALWGATPSLDLGATASVSRDRIAEYRDEAAGATYREVPPILSPAFVGGHRVTWRAAPWLALTADGRYQSRSYLAPTGDARLTTPPFYVLDGGLAATIAGRTLTLQARNLLDRRAYPSGDVSDGIAQYYILAPRSADLTLRVPF